MRVVSLKTQNTFDEETGFEYDVPDRIWLTDLIPEGVTSASISSEGSHHIPRGHRVIAKPVLGGLHHEYELENIAA